LGVEDCALILASGYEGVGGLGESDPERWYFINIWMSLDLKEVKALSNGGSADGCEEEGRSR
jgi:hypothetical protein